MVCRDVVKGMISSKNLLVSKFLSVLASLRCGNLQISIFSHVDIEIMIMTNSKDNCIK